MCHLIKHLNDTLVKLPCDMLIKPLCDTDLVFYSLVVGFLKPGAENDAVVDVAHGAQQRCRCVGGVVCQRELSYQLSKQASVTP